MYLYLIQHGLSKNEDEDPKRPLTDTGRLITSAMAKKFSALNPQIHEIRHSTKLRAKETAVIIAEYLKKTDLLKEYENLSPNSDVSELTSKISATDKNIMIVGHLPYLSRLTSMLICNDKDKEVVKFKNSGIICLCREERTWHIEWYLTPDWL